MNDDGSIEDYIDKYCGMIKSKFKEQTRLEQLETQLTANGFCSLIEVRLGIVKFTTSICKYISHRNFKWLDISMI